MQYRYRAADALGRIQSGYLDAANLADLESRISKLGLTLIGAKGERLRVRVKRRDLLLFCFHLEQLTRAGVPLIDGLVDLRDSLDAPRFRSLIANVIAQIEDGKSLSQALAMHPAVFDAVFVHLIAVGEVSGELPQVLHNLGETLKWQDELIAQTQRILLYPAFVAALVLAVLVFLLLYLVPQLVEFIRAMQQTLPLSTQILLWLSMNVARFAWLLLGVGIAAGLILRWCYRANDRFKLGVDRMLLKLPIVGAIWHQIILARVANFFALLYGAGIPILDCIRIVGGLTQNAAMVAALAQVQEQVSAGQSVSASFAHSGLFPPLVLRMLRIGENTGRLDSALQNVTYFYHRDIKESIARVQALIEPVLTVVLGLILAWMMSSVLSPIFDLVSHLR